MRNTNDELTGYEEHMASLPDDSRFDGYDRGDLDLVECPTFCDAGPECFGLNIATVAGHMMWERNMKALDEADQIARAKYLAAGGIEF